MMTLGTWLRPSSFWGDFADRFTHRYSFNFFATLAISLGIHQRFGQSFKCWVPAQFTDNWEIYATEYCRLESTFYLPPKMKIPNDFEETHSRQFSDALWTPIFLLWTATVFLLPGFCWKTVAAITAIPFPGLTTAAQEAAGLGGAARSKAFRGLAGRLQLSAHHPRAGNVLGTILYLLLKIFYIFFWYWQIGQVNHIFKTDQHYPIRVLRDIRNGSEWEELENFPKIIICPFDVQVLGNLYHYRVQCAPTINQLIPLLVVVIYAWLLVGVLLALVSALVWMATAVVAVMGPCRGMLLGPLVVAAEGGPIVQSDLHQFLSQLPSDAIFLLRIIQTRVGDLPAQEIMAELWSARHYWAAQGKKWMPMPPNDCHD